MRQDLAPALLYDAIKPEKQRYYLIRGRYPIWDRMQAARDLRRTHVLLDDQLEIDVVGGGS